ncbi:phosphate ABC transporter ATP-binding protein [Bordetella bronchiseptica]|uniref:ABC transporter ATP-binding protein n=1 Tax=Bordetella bronchiseptica TaxID=518 RepID=UPI0004618DBA|nr:phosphate ABC transporter ATP-binding protein [Bordetella bronchiseptica]KDC60351.1 ABC transporter, ATP-binding protein [Bordetella bronchiseptica MBORD595]VEF41170.1 Nickel import ATP-binding protein NikO [Bordetella bronchiseptica]
MTVLFDLRGADVYYGPVHALREAEVRICAGEQVALVGANGSGKSTLLRLLHGLVTPRAGQARCAARARQAMVFQQPYMLRTSAQNNVALALWLRGMRWREARARALHALERVELTELAGRNAKSMSGGQQQRLALARAWALEPEALLLDEPTASLDPHAKRDVELLMEQFARPRDGLAPAMIFSSHNLGQVKRLARRVIYLERGRILADLPVDQFFNGPLPEAAALFVKGERIP